MVNIRSHQAQAVLKVVTKAVTEGRDLNQLNSNGVSLVRQIVKEGMRFGGTRGTTPISFKVVMSLLVPV